jgi:hypothetical protein
MKAVIDRFASSPKGEGDLAILRPRSPVSRLPHLPRNLTPSSVPAPPSLLAHHRQTRLPPQGRLLMSCLSKPA